MTEGLQHSDILRQWIGESERVVFFGGAGTSTESHIPDFRSESGLYQTKSHAAYPPEVMLSRSFFYSHPEDFYDFYKSKMLYPHARPNRAHEALAELERRGKLKAVITQNIDGLHQMAGSSRVLELHGSVYRNVCTKCKARYVLNDILESKETIPVCSSCGGIIKPDVVLYEEQLDSDLLYGAAEEISSADMLIVGGTSLTVNPAASLVRYYRGDRLVLINRTATDYDRHADLVIREPIGEVLGSAVFGRVEGE
jgi:NAD-dependent deacetylase